MHRVLRLVLLGGIASSYGLAQDIPLRNWTVPPYSAASAGGIHTMTDATPPRVFVGVVPCRVADTRGNGAPITGGIFANSEQRNWDVTGICGIPAGADAISVNFTIVSAPATPAGAFLLAWPTPNVPANPVAIMTYGPGTVVLSNAAIVTLGFGEVMTVNVSHSTHIIMDVNGYFSDVFANPNTYLSLTTNSYNPVISVGNQNTDGGDGLAGTSAGGNGVSGVTTGTGSAHIVAGVYGGSNSTNFGSAGVRAEGYYKGLLGVSQAFNNSAGVFGIQQSGITTLDSYSAAGVRGEGPYSGVVGISPVEGVGGSLLSAGHEIAWGALGLAANIATDPGCPSSPCSGPWAIMAGGNIGATGSKYFLDPHPSDPTLSIAYISLEGPEAGTYFRGRGRFQNGMARIPVPEHFRLVTDPEGLTVQITPIGEMASFAVVRMDLDEIVVKASRNVEFSYLVQGVRESFKDAQPLRRGGDFMPRSPDAKMPDWLSPEQKRLLVRNGTYREDGTVNRETARRLGWDKVWEERSGPRPQPANP